MDIKYITLIKIKIYIVKKPGVRIVKIVNVPIEELI